MMKPVDIKIELLRLDLPGAAIARRLGVGRTYVYHVIMRRNKNRRVRRAIAEALNLSYEHVWGEEDKAA